VAGVVVALEKVCGLDHVVVRLTVLHKYDSKSNYQWNLKGKPSKGVLNHETFTYYLVQKADKDLVRIRDYEILNTEIRTLLFSHSFGYK